MFFHTFAADTDIPSSDLLSKDTWDQALDFATQQGLAFLLNLVTAIAIFLVGRWIARLMTGVVVKILGRANVEDTLTKFLKNILYWMLITFVALAALDRLGVNTTSFAAILAAAGLAVGLALQGSLSNFASGVMIILFHPFRVGHYIEAGGTAGTVEEISIFSTILRTGDNRKIIVPNSSITGGTITNVSANPSRRIDLTIGCGYDDDLKAVKEFLVELLHNNERVLQEPAPVVAVDSLGESSVNFVVRPWVNSGDYGSVKWELTEALKLGFDERGFSIPYPTRHLNVHQVQS